METEIWKPVKNYEEYYQVSNYGKVKSLHRKGRIMKLSYGNDGYGRTMLSKNGKPITHRVHRLVAIAFIPFVAGKLIVNHKDYNPSNNYYENLEWATVAENSTHMHKMRKLKVVCPTCGR